MKIQVDPRLLVTSALANLLFSGSASAHPGHYGHVVDQSATTGFLQDIMGLGPMVLACSLTCLALYLGRGIYRKLP